MTEIGRTGTGMWTDAENGRSEPRRVVVTGASQGIGLAVSRALMERGWWVAMVARRADALRQAADEIGGHAFPADVTSDEAVLNLAESLTADDDRPLDAIVNSAGAFSLAPLVSTAVEDFDRQIAVNLRGPFLLIRTLLPAMIARGAGNVVNIGSVAGRLAFPGNAGYSASKFGLRGLHEVLAAELAGTGVRATLIEPAATDTALWDPLDPDARTDLPSRSEMLTPADVARTVAFALDQPTGVELSYLAVRAAR